MGNFCVKLTQTSSEPPIVLRASLRDRVRAGQPHDAGGHPSINDVRYNFGFFDPLPSPCPQIQATSLTKVAYYVCF